MTEQSYIRTDTSAQLYRFTQQDFLVLAETGAFESYAKAELIDGSILTVNAQYSRHARMQTLFFRALAAACDRLDGDAAAWIESTVDAGEGNYPQPDLFIASALPEQGPVPAANVLIAIEIADTSLDFDLKQKDKIYANAGVPEYWVVDVEQRVIHQLWTSEGGTYFERREVAFGAVLNATTLAGLQVETGQL